jgi:hypothetical protein
MLLLLILVLLVVLLLHGDFHHSHHHRGGDSEFGSFTTNTAATTSAQQKPISFVSLFAQKRFSWLPLPHVAAQAFYAPNLEHDLLPSLRRLSEENFAPDLHQLPCVVTVDEITGALFVPQRQISEDLATQINETADNSRLMVVFKSILQDIVTEHYIRYLISNGKSPIFPGAAGGGAGAGGASEPVLSAASFESDTSNFTVASRSFKSMLGRSCCDSILYRSAFFWANWCRRYSLTKEKAWDLIFVGLSSDRDASHWLQKKTIALIESQLRI